MPLTPERITRLREFGLSEYAARCYLALLDLGVTEARDASALSKVPASKIYHVLDQLHEKGLCTILPEFPRKYAPVPFGDYLRRLHAEHAAEAAAIERDLEALSHTFAVVGDAAGGDRGGATLARGRRNTLQVLADLAQGTTSDLLLALPRGLAAEPKAWSEITTALAARGVAVRVLSPQAIDVPGAQVRVVPAPIAQGSLVAIADGRRALLAHVLPDDGHATEGSDTTLLIDQEGLGPLLAALAEAEWARASPGRSVAVREAAAPPTAPQA